MIRLTADQLYYQHRVLCLRRPLWPLGEFSLTKIDGLWPNTTVTGLLARDREYFWIRLQPSFRVACQRGGSLRLEAVRCGVVYCCPSLSFDWPTIRQSLTVDTGGAGSAESRRRAVRPAGRRCLMTVSPRQRTPNGVGWPSYKTHHDLINQNRFFCHILIIKETRGRR